MAALRAGHLAEGARCDLDRMVEWANCHTALRPAVGTRRLWRQASLSSADRYGPHAPAYRGGAAEDQCGGGPWASAAEAHTDSLRCRADSAVAKTPVHWPADVRLLWDALHCLIRHLARLSQQHAIAGWRKARFWIKQVKRAFDRIRTARQWRNKEKVAIYLARSREIGGESCGYAGVAAAKPSLGGTVARRYTWIDKLSSKKKMQRAWRPCTEPCAGIRDKGRALSSYANRTWREPAEWLTSS